MLGTPEMSFTENRVPVSEFETLNNCPAEPSIESVPLFAGYIVIVMFCAAVEESAPLNTIFGSAVDEPMFGVITMFLLLFAMVVP
jgi:hypothetical protein